MSFVVFSKPLKFSGPHCFFLLHLITFKKETVLTYLKKCYFKHPAYHFLRGKNTFQAELPCFTEAQWQFFFSKGLIFNFAILQRTPCRIKNFASELILQIPYLALS